VIASQVPIAATPLGVLTFNTGNDLIEPSALIGVIAQTGATITGLQELSPKNADALQTSLRDELPHRVLYGEFFHGKGLLSCYPILEHERFEVPSGRSFLRATLQFATDHAFRAARTVTVFVAHPPPPDPRFLELAASVYSHQDVTALLKRASLDTPTLLIGDFNCVRANRAYQLLRKAGLIDTFRVAGRGMGLTYPVRQQHARVPVPRIFRLDYIWVTRHFLPVRSEVLRAPGSDHRPVFSRLELL
jgi:endonuclease/exonuclease/phosphatase family metal-dependent hydrolase